MNDPNQPSNDQGANPSETGSSLSSNNSVQSATLRAAIVALVLSALALSASGYLAFRYARRAKSAAETARILARMDSVRRVRLDSLSRRLTAVEIDMLALKYAGEGKAVDLAVSDLQHISTGFSVAQLSVDQQMSGIKVRGIVINRESVDHKMASFEITVFGSSNTFTIQSLPRGSSKRFEVYVPDVPPDKARWATIVYESSTVEFR